MGFKDRVRGQECDFQKGMATQTNNVISSGMEGAKGQAAYGFSQMTVSTTNVFSK